MHDSNALIGAIEIIRCSQCLRMIFIDFQIVWGIDTMRVRVDESMENRMFLGEYANHYLILCCLKGDKRMGIKKKI